VAIDIRLKALLNFLQVVRGSSWAMNITKVYAGDIASKALAGITVIVLVRSLNTQDYAAFIAFNTIVFLIPGLIGGGINLALIRFASERLSISGSRNMTLYLLSFLCQILLFLFVCVLLIASREQFTKLLFGDQTFDSALILGLLGGLGYLILKAGISVYQAEEKFNTTIILNLSQQVLKFATLIVLLAFNILYYKTAAATIVISQLVIALFVFWHIFRTHNPLAIIKNWSSCRKDVRVFMSSTYWLIAYIFMLTAFQRLDVFMLSHFSSSEELAAYGVSFQYYALALMALGAIHSVLLPKFSKIEMQDPDAQTRFVSRWLKLSVWLLLPIMLINLLGKPIFLWVNGEVYAHSFEIFTVFSFGIWLSLMFSPLVNVLMARNDFFFLFFSSVLALMLNAAGNYYFIPLYGGYAAAWTTIVSHAFIQLLILGRIRLNGANFTPKTESACL